MKKQVCTAVRATLAGGLLGLLFASSAITASGFRVPELSALGVGTANAVVANPDETGAFAYNPSAMGFHDRSSIALGTVLINPNFEVTTASGNHDSEGADWVALPILQAALKVHEQWRIGIGIGAPFGLETRWKVGTFPKLSGTTPIPTGSHPTVTKLETIALTPTVAFRVNDDLSFAAGLDYYKAREAKLESQLAKVEGGGDAWGWNASLLYRNNAFSFGADYHSAATIDLEGSFTPTSRTLEFLGVLAPAQGGRLDVNLPWRLQLGVRYQVNEALAAEFDWTRMGWSEFEKLAVVGTGTGLISSDEQAWKDANAYRIGLTYDVRPTTQLRFGYSYDETAQDDEHYSPRVPDNDRQLFAIGVRQKLGREWAIEAAYMYVSVADRKVRSNVPYQRLGNATNGTDAYDGDYSSNSNVITLEARKTF